MFVMTSSPCPCHLASYTKPFSQFITESAVSWRVPEISSSRLDNIILPTDEPDLGPIPDLPSWMYDEIAKLASILAATNSTSSGATLRESTPCDVAIPSHAAPHSGLEPAVMIPALPQVSLSIGQGQIDEISEIEAGIAQLQLQAP